MRRRPRHSHELKSIGYPYFPGLDECDVCESGLLQRKFVCSVQGYVWCLVHGLASEGARIFPQRVGFRTHDTLREDFAESIPPQQPREARKREARERQ